MRALVILVVAFALGVTTYLRVTGEKPIGWSGKVWGVFEGAPPPRALRALVQSPDGFSLIVAPPGGERAAIPSNAKVALARNGEKIGELRVRAVRTTVDGAEAVRLTITGEEAFEKITYVIEQDSVRFVTACAHGQLGMFVGLFDGALVGLGVVVLGALLTRMIPKRTRRARAPSG
jgi:hypothetical protein